MNRNGVEDRGTREEAAQLCARGAGSYSGAGVSLSGCAEAVWGEGIVSPEELVFHPQGKGHIFPWLGHWATQCHMLLLATYAPLNYDRGSVLELAWLHINNGKMLSVFSKPQVSKLGYWSFQEESFLKDTYVNTYICACLCV